MLGKSENIMVDTLDLTNLNEAFDGDREGIAELLDESVEFIAGAQTEMRAALAAGDAPSIAKAAHTLKGTSANIGAQIVSAISAKIEADAKAGQLAELPSVFNELGDALGALHDAVAAYKRSA
ncbi:MAG TPA: Hpt domain-containing protein [Candidatus Baltobacteraceae bacterium]